MLLLALLIVVDLYLFVMCSQWTSTSGNDCFIPDSGIVLFFILTILYSLYLWVVLVVLQLQPRSYFGGFIPISY
jgi:hypothetical protein